MATLIFTLENTLEIPCTANASKSIVSHCFHQPAALLAEYTWHVATENALFEAQALYKDNIS